MKKNDLTFKDKLAAVKLMVMWAWKTSRPLTIFIAFTTICAGLIGIVEPYIFKILIDRLVRDQTLVENIFLAVGGVLLTYGTALFVQQMVFDGQVTVKKLMAQRLEKTVALDMMKKVSSLDSVYFDTPEYYDTLKKANEQFWRINDFFWHITFSLANAISILVIAITLFSYNFLIALLVLAGAIPQIWFSTRTTRVLWGAFDAASPIAREAEYYKKLMTERTEAVKEIRLFNLSDFILKKFDSRINDFIKAQDKAAFKELGGLIAISFTSVIFSILAAFLIIKSYINEGLSLGTLTFLWALLFQFSNTVKWTVSSLRQINDGATFATPYVKILRFKSSIHDPTHPKPFPAKIQSGIEFRNVSFTYPGSSKPTLKNLSFILKAGENVAVVGENGSGKTTLTKLLCRLYDPSEGEILIDGINIKEFSLKDLYKNIGIIFQDFMKYEASALENIGYGNINKISNENIIKEAARKSGASEFINDLEKSYKTHLGRTLKEEGTELSIGQWQKMALARAFFKEGQIMVLDEPTAAVDARAEYELFKRFEKLTQGKTTLLISHRFSTVRMASTIIVLEKGRIVEKGSHRELLRTNGRYANLFKLQAEGYQS